MKVLSNLKEFHAKGSPLSLTLGNFDGVHLGHLCVLAKVREASSEHALITFSNHPQQILRGASPSLLTSLEHKLKLLKQTGIHTTLLLPFTKELAQKTAEAFLEDVRSSIPFTHLVLGHDAYFGRQKEGNKETLSRLSEKMDFTIEYIEPVLIDQIPISSSLIRSLIEKGSLKHAEALLGRPFSILGRVIYGKGLGKQLGFPTANILPEGIVLPPFGVYAVRAIIDDIPFKGIANLGINPTIPSPHPILEVHLLGQDQSLYGKEMEVQFLSFLREEKKFPDLDSLKKQIAADISLLT